MISANETKSSKPMLAYETPGSRLPKPEVPSIGVCIAYTIVAVPFLAFGFAWWRVVLFTDYRSHHHPTLFVMGAIAILIGTLFVLVPLWRRRAQLRRRDAKMRGRIDPYALN